MGQGLLDHSSICEFILHPPFNMLIFHMNIPQTVATNLEQYKLTVLGFIDQ